MKTLYLDCSMGAAGDMLTAALLELLPDREAFVSRVNALGLPGIHMEAVPSVKCGIYGTHSKITVNGVDEADLMAEHEHEHHHDHEHEHEHDHEHEHEHEHEHDHDHEHYHDHDHEHHHHHSSLADIQAIIDSLAVDDAVKADVTAVYTLIAEAESHAHNMPVTDIHFHEVGTMDAVADVTAVCMLMHEIAPDQIFASPVHVGSGHVHCAHGILPVPAPATAYILRGVPIYSGNIRGELCTPTGAALLKHFVKAFIPMPVMAVSAIGYGMGNKDFEQANCVRALLGETEGSRETVTELVCTIDDMTAEAVGFATERFWEAGALDVYTIPIQMKKNRPGLLLEVMCRNSDKDKMLRLVFKHTTTLGIREYTSARYTLTREMETIETPGGIVHRKKASGFGTSRSKLEYEDLAKIARENNISLAEAAAIANRQ